MRPWPDTSQGNRGGSGEQTQPSRGGRAAAAAAKHPQQLEPWRPPLVRRLPAAQARLHLRRPACCGSPGQRHARDAVRAPPGDQARADNRSSAARMPAEPRHARRKGLSLAGGLAGVAPPAPRGRPPPGAAVPGPTCRGAHGATDPLGCHGCRCAATGVPAAAAHAGAGGRPLVAGEDHGHAVAVAAAAPARGGAAACAERLRVAPATAWQLSLHAGGGG
mmetsp:Transcript_5600/g.17601  ORF Transcript_5600/g.17601 Transcript_5600/m.17601 type:complete len:220 (-) Transcript_5600:298-957(-)